MGSSATNGEVGESAASRSIDAEAGAGEEVANRGWPYHYAVPFQEDVQAAVTRCERTCSPAARTTMREAERETPGGSAATITTGSGPSSSAGIRWPWSGQEDVCPVIDARRADLDPAASGAR